VAQLPPFHCSASVADVNADCMVAAVVAAVHVVAVVVLVDTD